MRALPLCVLALAACGAPLEDEQLPVEVKSSTLRSWSLRLGEDRCSGTCELPSRASEGRVSLVAEGVTADGRAFTVDRDVWLPAGRDLVAVDVDEAQVRLHFIDLAPPPGVSLSGRTLTHDGPGSLLAFGGCELHRLRAGTSVELDCLPAEGVGLQLTDVIAPDVTLTTTYLLTP